MKKLLTLSLLLSSVLSVSAQTVFPFPLVNAVWTQRIGHGDAPPSYNYVGTTIENMVVGGNTYFKLFASADNKFDATEYIGGIRQDASGKVYFYNASRSAEVVLYDFTLGVGDTATDPITGGKYGVVDHIDSVSISGAYHKRWNFTQASSGSTWLAGSWIEGIGNSALGGLLGSPMMQPTCDCATNTVCFSQNGNWVYHNTNYPLLDCSAVLEVKPVTCFATVPYGLYPNPVTSASVLSFEPVYDRAYIRDITGRMVMNTNVNGQSEITIDRANYASGVYIYQLIGANGKTTTGKFVVE